MRSSSILTSLIKTNVGKTAMVIGIAAVISGGITVVANQTPTKGKALAKSELVRRDLTSVKGIEAFIESIKAQEGMERPRTKPEKDEPGEEEEKGLDYLEALLHYTKQRAYPNDKIDAEAYERARDYAAKMKPGRIGASKAPADSKSFFGAVLGGRWSYLGPNNLDVPYRIYYGVRPTTGRVNAIAYDPSNTNIFYVGGAQGGVMKTTDGGRTYTPLGDTWPVNHVSCIAVDPTRPTTLYVGTGDFPGSTPYSNGIMKSTDGGLTWTTLGRATFAGTAVSKIAIDPETPNTLIATTGRGSRGEGFVYRSTDGGNTWSTVINVAAPWSDVDFSAANNGNRNYYAVGGGNGGNVYKSTDKGATWTKLSPSVASGYHSNMAIAASKTNPQNVYLLSIADQKIYKSTDGGSTWADSTGNFPGGYNWSQGWYDYHIETAPGSGNNDQVFVGLIDIVRSSDSGGTWASIGGPTYSNVAITHNDQHSFALNPRNPNEILIGNDGGLYRGVINGSTVTLTGLSSNLGLVQFYSADWHPTNPSIILGGTQDNASPTSRGDLNNWDNVGGGDGGYCAINPANPQIQFCEAQGMSIYRTDNGWASSRYIAPDYGSDRVPFIGVFALEAATPNNLLAGTNFLWRYDTARGTWSPRIGGQQLSSRGTISAIATSPANRNIIYTGASDGELWMSSNAGVNWTRINTGLPNRAIGAITVSPTNANDIVVGMSGTGTGHIYRCTNTASASRVWTSLNGSGTTAFPDIPVNTIAFDPKKPGEIWYVGTDIGVFTTGNAGSTWENATNALGLPNVQVNALKAVGATGFLNAATYGRGAWRIAMGQESIFGPQSISAFNGQLVSGSRTDLMANDNQGVTLSSILVSGLGQATALRANYVTGASRANIQGATFTIAGRSSGQVTQLLFLRNQQTNQWESVQTNNVGTATATFTLNVTDVAKYFSAGGNVDLVIRQVYPARLTSPVFTQTVDQAVLTLRTSN